MMIRAAREICMLHAGHSQTVIVPVIDSRVLTLPIDMPCIRH
jgi:hypothetical protein